MPRRKGQVVESAIQNEAINRWQILLRNETFQKDLNQLRNQYRQWIKGPQVTLYNYESEDSDMDEFETMIPRQTESKIDRKDIDWFDHECDPNDSMVGIPEGAWPEFNSKWGVYLPKAALSDTLPDLRQNTIDQWTAIPSNEPAIVPVPVKANHRRRNWLSIEVNLGYPRDILIEKIEDELKKATALSRKFRRRWDKFHYYLEIYDLAVKGETFRTIAQTYRKRVSTVKSAYLAIKKSIYYCDFVGMLETSGRGRALPKKKQQTIMNVDIATHILECPVCRMAKKAEYMCVAARTFVDQDTRGREDSPRDDLDKFQTIR